MRWYNNTDEVQPIQPRGFGSGLPLATSRPSLAAPSTPLATPQSAGRSFNVDSLTQILTTGAVVAGTIGGQRAASGAAAQRQARIEACGRKGLGYLFSRRKKEEYRRCVEAANAASYGGGADKSYSPPPPPQKSNTMLFIGIGAVVVIGAAAYFFMRKK
jgi:hypothetical protein